MSLPTEKLELVRMLLDTDDQYTLDQAKVSLKQDSSQETDHLLSDEVNVEHLQQGMEQATKGDYKPVNVNRLVVGLIALLAGVTNRVAGAMHHAMAANA